MAGFQHSKNSEVYLDDSGGALRKITSYVTGVEGLPGEQELNEITALGDVGRKFIPGLQNATFSVDFFYNSDPSTGGGFADMALQIFGTTATKSFEYYPDTTASGKRKINGECWLRTVPLNSRVGDLVAGRAEFQVDGAVTITTV